MQSLGHESLFTPQRSAVYSSADKKMGHFKPISNLRRSKRDREQVNVSEVLSPAIIALHESTAKQIHRSSDDWPVTMVTPFACPQLDNAARYCAL